MGARSAPAAALAAGGVLVRWEAADPRRAHRQARPQVALGPIRLRGAARTDASADLLAIHDKGNRTTRAFGHPVRGVSNAAVCVRHRCRSSG